MRVSMLEIALPAEQDPDAFATFMRDEFVPAIDHRPSRIGMAERVELVERAGIDADAHRFLWLVHFDGGVPGALSVAVGEEQQRRFDAFGACIHDKVVWQEVGRWSTDDGDR